MTPTILTASVPCHRARETSTSLSGGGVESSRDTTKADEWISRMRVAFLGIEDKCAKS